MHDAGHEAALAEFASLYAAGRFFDAHEALEVVWRRSDDLPMRFLQGLIQWAVAFEHHRRGNSHGARVLMERSLGNLAGAPPGYLGVDLSACRAAAADLRRALADWDAGGARPDLPAPPIAVATTPPGGAPARAEVSPSAALVLVAARRAVGRAAARGAGIPDVTAASLAAALEADAGARAALDAAASARPPADTGEAPGRPGRAARADEVHRAVDELLLAGELSPDGPGRVVLPGFGPVTWRAIAVLRDAGTGSDAAWAAAVAADPLGDLGDAAPAALRDHRTDPALRPAARRLLARQADRQDLRDALLRAGGAAAHAAARGLADSLASIEADAARLQAALERADRDLEALWLAGARRAGGGN